MKPCDCKDQQDVKKLDHCGLSLNNESIEVCPNNVILTVGACTIKISQTRFKAFALWYLEDQPD